MTNVATINAGSSSLKFAVFRGAASPVALLRGQIEGIGVAPQALLRDAQGALLMRQDYIRDGFDHAAAAREMLRLAGPWLDGADLSVVGHRVVHGGLDFAAPVLLDDRIVARLEALAPLAPLHQPHNLAVIRALRAVNPELAQVACFDTAFHRDQPLLATSFAIPRKFTEDGVRRYGFHGLSYQSVLRQVIQIAPEMGCARIIAAHLGNGASLCAIQESRSVASTMGFTAVDGLMMGTRCGSIDPGALIYLMDSYGMGPRELEELIYRRSGLLGVSGLSSDMRLLRASSEMAAKEAIDLFVYRIIREIGSLAAALGGLDAVVFTGGIGENDPETRAAVAQGCRWLGLEIDEEMNRAPTRARISAPGSKIAVFVVATDEEIEIARSAWDLFGLL